MPQVLPDELLLDVEVEDEELLEEEDPPVEDEDEEEELLVEDPPAPPALDEVPVPSCRSDRPEMS